MTRGTVGLLMLNLIQSFLLETTVGYGDMYPTTVAGKIVATPLLLLNSIHFPLPPASFEDLFDKN